MSATAIVINSFAIIGFIISFIKNKKNSVQTLRVTGKSFFKMLPMVLIIVVLVGLLLGSIPTGLLYVAFPLAAAMFEEGARTMNIVVFLSAWAAMKIPRDAGDTIPRTGFHGHQAGTDARFRLFDGPIYGEACRKDLFSVSSE